MGIYTCALGSCKQCNIGAVMAQPPLVQFGRHVLSDNGFTGSAERAQLVAHFLARNQLTKLVHLQHADHPSTWLGAQTLEAAELEIVWGLRKVARLRSRRDTLQTVPVHVVAFVLTGRGPSKSACIQ